MVNTKGCLHQQVVAMFKKQKKFSHLIKSSRKADNLKDHLQFIFLEIFSFLDRFQSEKMGKRIVKDDIVSHEYKSRVVGLTG